MEFSHPVKLHELRLGINRVIHNDYCPGSCTRFDIIKLWIKGGRTKNIPGIVDQETIVGRSTGEEISVSRRGIIAYINFFKKNFNGWIISIYPLYCRCASGGHKGGGLANCWWGQQCLPEPLPVPDDRLLCQRGDHTTHLHEDVGAKSVIFWAENDLTRYTDSRLSQARHSMTQTINMHLVLIRNFMSLLCWPELYIISIVKFFSLVALRVSSGGADQEGGDQCVKHHYFRLSLSLSFLLSLLYCQAAHITIFVFHFLLLHWQAAEITIFVFHFHFLLFSSLLLWPLQCQAAGTLSRLSSLPNFILFVHFHFCNVKNDMKNIDTKITVMLC